MANKFDAESSGISEEGLYIRSEYCANMQGTTGSSTYGKYNIARWDGGRDEDGRLYKANVWDKLVQFFKANSLDTGAYLEFAFGHYGIKTPNDLKRDDIVSAYKNFMFNTKPPLLFTTGERILENNFKIRRSYEPTNELAFSRVVNDNACGVSPLVRYSYACSKQAQALVDNSIKEAAFVQYMNKRFFYDHFFKDKIPKEFLERLE